MCFGVGSIDVEWRCSGHRCSSSRCSLLSVTGLSMYNGQVDFTQSSILSVLVDPRSRTVSLGWSKVVKLGCVWGEEETELMLLFFCLAESPLMRFSCTGGKHVIFYLKMRDSGATEGRWWLILSWYVHFQCACFLSAATAKWTCVWSVQLSA